MTTGGHPVTMSVSSLRLEIGWVKKGVFCGLIRKGQGTVFVMNGSRETREGFEEDSRSVLCHVIGSLPNTPQE